MSKGLEVFGVHGELVQFKIEEAKAVVSEKLNPSWIKQRTVGKTTLSYIGGQTVIRLLNKAFNYQWSFEIVSEEIVPSVPKLNKYAKAGQDPLEPQPPVVKVLGRLTIPGIGVKEQYGSKVLIGGASEQESAFKSASTDALKKCASLLGIGLELYGEDEGMDDVVEVASTPSTVVPPQQQAPTVEEQVDQMFKQEQAPKVDTTHQAPPQQQAAPQQTASPVAGGWNPDDISRLKDLKAILGIPQTQNELLNPYVREFFDNPDVTWSHITPDNIKAVNIFLAKKAEAI